LVLNELIMELLFWWLYVLFVRGIGVLFE